MDHRSLRILAVEDQPVNVALLRAVLSRIAGAQLTVAETVAGARTELGHGRFDVVVLDVGLPDGSGLELMTDIAAADPRPRVLVLTASALPAEEAAAREAGADAFIAKPYEPSQLVEALDRLSR